MILVLVPRLVITRFRPEDESELFATWVVLACLGYSRAGAGALMFSKQTPDLLWGHRPLRVVARRAATALVWDRQAGLHAHDGRPIDGMRALEWGSASIAMRASRARSST